MIHVFCVLQLPSHVEGYVNGPGTDGEGWSNITLQRVANHQQLRRMDMLMFAECHEFFLSFVRGYLHIIKER